MTILKTTDYEMFRCISGNRDINERNLKKIVASIKYKNMLNINPIIVDRNLGIIDGQHRWHACKLLGVPIYYIIKDTFDPVDIISLNAAKKCWSLDDYVKYYSEYGEPIFKKLLDLMNKHNYTITEVLSYMGNESGGVKSAIKMGIFKGDIDYLSSVIGDKKKQIEEITLYIKKRSLENTYFTTSAAFRTALVALITSPGFSQPMFMSKLSQLVNKITRRTGRKDYFKMLVDIYNHRNSNPIIVDES